MQKSTHTVGSPIFRNLTLHNYVCVFLKNENTFCLNVCPYLKKNFFNPAPHFLPINKSCHECFTTRCSSKKDYYFELVNESVKCVKSDLYLEKYTRHFSWTHSMSFLCNFHYLPRVTVNDQGVVAFRIWIKTQQVCSNTFDDYKSRKFYIIIFAKVSSTPCMLLHFGGKIDCFLRLQQQ